MKKANKQLLGYRRSDGSIGIRNYIAVFSTALCTGPVAPGIASQMEGVIALQNDFCDADDETFKRMVGIGCNPNIAAVLVIGVDCEGTNHEKLAEKIAESGKPCAALSARRTGGVRKTIEKGIPTVRQMRKDALQLPKEKFSVRDLVIGVECGGSDATSGIAANPAAGKATDLLIEAGGTAILNEPGEMLGCADILAKRAVNEEVGRQVREVLEWTEKYFRRKYKILLYDKELGLTKPSILTPGNIDGGLTTLREKSLGAISKGGSMTIKGVLNAGEKDKLVSKGLFIMREPEGSYGTDVGEFTDFLTVGAQMVIFTTGRGSLVGSALAPVIKVTGNPETYSLVKEHMDINASPILRGRATIEEIGNKIYEKIIEVASGGKTKSEILGNKEFQLLRVPGSS